ncbi:transposase (fragment) [Vibrio crassostreae]
MNGFSLLDHISVTRDPRQAWEIELTLTGIIFSLITALIAGAEGWEDIEYFGEDSLEWLSQYGDFKQGIPVHYTIARVINLISAK